SLWLPPRAVSSKGRACRARDSIDREGSSLLAGRWGSVEHAAIPAVPREIVPHLPDTRLTRIVVAGRSDCAPRVCAHPQLEDESAFFVPPQAPPFFSRKPRRLLHAWRGTLHAQRFRPRFFSFLNPTPFAGARRHSRLSNPQRIDTRQWPIRRRFSLRLTRQAFSPSRHFVAQLDVGRRFPQSADPAIRPSISSDSAARAKQPG